MRRKSAACVALASSKRTLMVKYGPGRECGPRPGESSRPRISCWSNFIMLVFTLLACSGHGTQVVYARRHVGWGRRIMSDLVIVGYRIM